MAQAPLPSAQRRATRRHRRRWSLKAYILAIIVLFVAVVAAGTVYESRGAVHDAREAAIEDARFGADLGARGISTDLRDVQAVVAGTAANPGIPQVFRTPGGCTLSFEGAGTFKTGHLDVVGTDGTVACSSLAPAGKAAYGSAEWLTSARHAPVVRGPVSDPRTGKQVVVVASPVSNLGAVAAFLDLDSLGPGLASGMGGPRRLEFLVTTADGSAVLARSVDSNHWIAAPVAGTPFAGASDAVQRPDVDGTTRLYGSAAVDGVGWHVYAGADRAQALAAADRLRHREFETGLAGLLVLLVAALVIYRRIAKPINQLSASVRAASTHGAARQFNVSGPAEVVALGEGLGSLVAAADRELEGASRLSAIVESSGDAIIGMNPDGSITSWNASAERMYGYREDEVLGRSIVLLVPSDRIGELEPIRTRVVRGERLERFETQRLRKDGSLVDVSLTTSPILDPTGVMIGASAVVRDITESKRAVQALRASEARKTAILGSALDCIITMDSQGRIVEFNPAAERTFGYDRAEVTGQVMADLIIPESLRERHRAGLAHYLATGEGPILGERLELNARRADGSELPIELTVTKVDLPGPPLFTGFLRDLTLQRAVQAELAESEQRLQAILDNSPAMVHMKDLDGRYLFINRQVERTLGVDRAHVTGRTDAELWPSGTPVARNADRYLASAAEVLRTGQIDQFELITPGPGGDHHYFAVTFPLFDSRGQAYATAGFSTDITARKRAETERRSLEARLHQSQRLESLGQLAGGIAHDFNNLLAVILNYASFVSEQLADDDAARADVEQIRAAAERAARLTQQLLIFGRRDTVQPEILDLSSVVADLESLLSRSIGEHVELVVHAGASVPPIRVDRGQIEQILVNLAVNARDAMRSGGTLTIETGSTELDEEYVRLHPDSEPGRFVVLSVSDTGVGMSAEVLTHLFEPFFTTKPKGQGTGLGLATVYGIVTEAGGSVSVYSEEGLGTTFRVYLPPVDEPASLSEASGQTEPVGGQGETVLVVEDEEAILEVTARMLRRNGYLVLEAATGAEALALACHHDFQLLLTDSVMPHISGRELAGRIQELRPDIPVLFMSGYSQGVLGVGRVLDDDVALIHKPFNEPALLEKIRAVLTAANG